MLGATGLRSGTYTEYPWVLELGRCGGDSSGGRGHVISSEAGSTRASAEWGYSVLAASAASGRRLRDCAGLADGLARVGWRRARSERPAVVFHVRRRRRRADFVKRLQSHCFLVD